MKISQEKYNNLVYNYFISLKKDTEDFDFYRYSQLIAEKCGLDTILKFTFNVDPKKCFYTLTILDKYLFDKNFKKILNEQCIKTMQV